MRTSTILIFVLLLSSCVKDDVDLATLNTNPLDQDYSGAPYITVTASNFFQFPNPVHQVTIEVDRSILQGLNSFDLHVKDLRTSVEKNLSAGSTTSTFVYENFDLASGVSEYCYDISVRVDFSDGPKTNFCDNP